MRQTVTYARLMALLLVSGAPVDRVEQLANRALGFAHERRSQVVGGRHLLMAAGVWDQAGTPERETVERSEPAPAASAGHAGG